MEDKMSNEAGLATYHVTFRDGEELYQQAHNETEARVRAAYYRIETDKVYKIKNLTIKSCEVMPCGFAA